MLPHFPPSLATVVLQIGYLTTGLLLCYFGKQLVEKGLTIGSGPEERAEGTKPRIFLTSPGFVFMLAGLVVIGTAVGTRVVDPTGGEARRGPSATAQVPLQDLAERVVLARFVSLPEEHTFAQRQIELARCYLEERDEAAARLSLLHAVIVCPEALKAVLADEDLVSLTSDPTFEAILRDRFELPLHNRILPHTLPAYLRVEEAGLRSQHLTDREDVSELLRQFPSEPGREPITATTERLREVLQRNPRSVCALLRTTDHRWMLRDERLLDELRLGMARLGSER